MVCQDRLGTNGRTEHREQVELREEALLLVLAGNNTLYVPGGNATISCGKASLNFDEFQSKGAHRGAFHIDNAHTNIRQDRRKRGDDAHVECGIWRFYTGARVLDVVGNSC